ncbi:unnamed protein product, partial [Discosporangium mesarthrocarpum]
PHTLLSDRGARFTVAVAREECKLMCTNVFTSANHPTTDGLVKRMNHTVSQALSFVVDENKSD